MKNKILILMFILFFISCFSVYAQNQVVAYEFYGRGCPHCAQEEAFLAELEERYPELEVQRFEIYFDDNNRQLFHEMANAFNTEIQGVPTLFINGKVIVGFSSSIGSSIEQEVKRCIEEGCPSPDEVLDRDIISVVGESSPLESEEKTELLAKLTIPAVLGAAVVDAINPCAFAVLIILMTTILAASSRKRSLFAGLAFSVSIYISYYLMGLGLFSAVQAAGITHWFYAIVAVLAILIGLFNLKDYLWYGKWFVMEVPLKWRPKMKTLLKGVTSVPGAFLVGFVVSLFLLPCTSGPYIVILGLLAKAATRSVAMLWLLLYNFIFILPMLIITLAIYFGFTTTAEAEHWREKKLKVLHLIAGAIILLLGIGMLIALFLGMV
ncbi:cytochrome c biogenesis CcdA family protein [Candidatus Woesearchaeota archaeon]|nr:cytochrome c biogenesis CcdA family protein [Candidatus Woesearchaeota archaeon]